MHLPYHAWQGIGSYPGNLLPVRMASLLVFRSNRSGSDKCWATTTRGGGGHLWGGNVL